MAPSRARAKRARVSGSVVAVAGVVAGAAGVAAKAAVRRAARKGPGRRVEMTESR